MLASESQIRSACLFFFLTLLDEKRAVRFAAEALALFQRKQMQRKSDRSGHVPLFIWCLIQKHRSIKNWRLAGQALVFSPEDWAIPNDLEIGPWLDFRNSADEDEFITVLLIKVLGFSAADVARGLQLTAGTIRYRVGRGLRELGNACQSKAVQ